MAITGGKLMTINIALHCRDGMVFGCDSLGSMIKPFIDPTTGVPIIDKSSGQPLLHPDSGEPIIDIRTMKSTNLVVNTLGYENKLLTIPGYPVGILTSGLGMIDCRCIEDLIGEFVFSSPPAEEKKISVKSVVDQLKPYLGSLYEKEFRTLPDIKAGPKLNLIIGGYSSSEYLGEIYQLTFPSGDISNVNSKEKPYMMMTSGQNDAIERFINGMETNTAKNIIGSLLNMVNAALSRMEKHTREHILSELKKRGIDAADIPPTPVLGMKEQVSFKLAKYNIPFNLFSIQNAVDFVVFLIYIVYGRQRFVVGIPTVGGKVKIAYITKHEGFRDLTPQKIDVSIFTI